MLTSKFTRKRCGLVGAINFLPAAGGEKSADTWVDEAEDRRKYALSPDAGADDGLPRTIIIDGHAGRARRY